MQNRGNTKKSWDREQDIQLLECISFYGPRSWELLAKRINGRSGKQCRERWKNQLNPLLKKGPWSVEENWILFIMYKANKNSWS